MKKNVFLFLCAMLVHSFDLDAQCTNPTGPAGDDCAIATPVCDPVLGLDEYCDQLDNNNSGPNDFPGCPNNVLNNDEWFTFVASGNTLEIQITPSNCGVVNPIDQGLQAALYEGSCDGDVVATQCDCTTSSFILSGTTTPGQTYYIVIDGCAGDVCDYEIQDLNGTTIPTAPPDLVPMGPDQVCPGLISTYTLPIANGDIYTWTISNPAIGTFQTQPPMGAAMDIEWMMEGTVDICVTATNACGLTSTIPPPVCLTVTSAQPPDINDMVNGCVGDMVECIAAPGVPQVVQPAPFTATIPLMDQAGCTYNVLCLVEPIINPPVDLGQVEICGPATYEICPGEIVFQTGLYFNVPCIHPVNGCIEEYTVDLAIFEPDAIIAQPIPELDCSSASSVMLDGSGSTLFSAAPGAVVDIDWTGPGIVGSTTDPIITVDEPGQYCLTITMSRNGNECSDTECVTVNENSQVPNAPTLAGEQNPCEGNTYTYDGDILVSPLPDDFGWVTPNNESFTTVDSNTIEIDWTGSAGGMLCVFGINDCGNGDTTCVMITVNEAPNLPVVNGPEDVCAVNQAETYSITNVQAGVSYTWTVPAGASFSGSGASISVNFDGANLGTGQVCATATNNCGTSNAGCFDVNIAAPPPTPDLTGPNSVCSNGSGYTYSVSNGQAGDLYNWTAPPGATITGSGSSVGIDFNGSQTGQVCVTLSNDCGNSTPSCENVTVVQAPQATISGMGELCEGVPRDIDLTIAATGSPPWDVTYTVDGMNPTTITINASPYTLTVNQPGVYELTSLSSSGGCDGSVNGMATITENPLPTAILSGSDGICENSGDLGQLTVVLTGEAPWTIEWESNGTPQASQTANASPFTLNVSEAQAGTITLTNVTDNNDCEGTTSGTGTVNVLQAPTVSSVVRECDPTNTTYTVTIVIQGGDPTTYSVNPENGSLSGNTFISNPIFSGLGYSFTISDANDCDPVLVEGSFECNCETMAGDMDLTAIETCGNGPVDVSGLYDNTNEFLDGDDVLQFIFHSGNGTTVTTPIVGEFATLGTVVFDPATMTFGQTYYLSAVVGNDDGMGGVDLADPCLSVSLGTPITFFEIPAAVLAGTDDVCEGEQGELTVTFTGASPWSLSYDDGTGNIQDITGINTNPYTLQVIPPSFGANTITLTAMSDSNCPGDVSGTGEITAHTGVVVNGLSVTCNSTATGFVVMFNISGGDPATYSVTGLQGTLTGGVFTSEEIPTGPGVGFLATVTDAFDCDPQTVSQTEVICDCESDAGQMDPAQVDVCGDGPITVPDATGVALDGDDLQLYYLHSASGNVLTNIIANNSTPVFSFDAASMTYGATYYVSSVVGNMDGSGGIDLNDPCLSVAPGTPVVFFEIPTATIMGGTEICPGGQADLMIELTGDAPWSVVVNGQLYDNIMGSPFPLPVEPDVTTTYQLTSVTSTDNGCQNDLMEEQTVTVHDPPAVTLDGEDCNATGTAYTVCFTISGGDNSCYMVTPNTGTLTGNQFCSDPINSGDGYSFEVTDCHNCPAVTISSLEVSCDCATQAGDIEPAPLSVCSDEMTPALNVSGNQFLDPDDALCFVLFSGSVALAVNPDESVFGFNPGNMVPGEVYQICPVAGNDDGSGCVDFSDPCLNIGGCVDVVFSPLPTAILDGTADVCLGEDPELEVELTGTGPWELTYQNSAGDVFVETVPTSPYILDVIPTVSTIISLTNVADANGCTNTITGNTATVNILQPPGFTNLVEDCNALETEFTVSFTITGGDPNTYMVDPPGTIVGNVFTSDPIPTNSNYTFLLDDGNGCGPTVISDGHACNCLTSVGTMQGGSLTLCEGDLTPASIYDSANEVLDPDDVRLFVLLSINSPIFNPANVIAVNPVEPVFGFDAATMSYGTTYYIAAVVGNNDGAGGIAPMDLCLAFSNFSIVRFFPLPTVSVSAPSAICDGDQATIEFTLTGTPPYDIIYTVNGLQDQLTGVVPMGSVFTADLPLATTTTITLVSITDANGCSNTASGSVTIEVNPLVEAGTATGTLDFCEGSNQTIELSNQLSGATPGGTWTTTSGQVIPTGSINVGTLPVGVNTLTYTVSGTPPCPDDVAEVLINITEAPVADAGPDLQLNCDITSVQLNPGNTTPGATITWTGSGITLPSDPNPVVTVPGIYTLTASIGNCTDVDEMVVELNVTTPQLYVAANPVSCFGETDGFVVVDSVSGGEPPYLFSLNNGPFTAQQSFLNLAPGSHTLTVEDNAGCMTTETFEIPEPEEVTVTLSATYPDPDIAPAVPLGESVTITASTTGGVDTIIWSPPGVDSLCVGCTQITFTPTQQTAISAVVDGNGCSDEDLLTVFINKERPVFVPNAFSPNDDLINDRLHIFGGKSAVVVKSFLIFNRWGELVFEFYNFPPAPLDYSVGWDGKYRGEYLNPGVFVWYAEIEFTDGSTGVYEGDVTLIR